ncbi:glycosyltransferase [Lignipirellula cremea]|uniref:Glycosyl transferase family 2 n=1 Tax=Lignipirellula cremea TaxID=2528010 RepID=A0A518DYY8_9BACT|nr:glycosyltransferase [Lignipirellula cremea]QDU97058.1 Glycosyl transferase family 2 [Lignipirellula cremea]
MSFAPPRLSVVLVARCDSDLLKASCDSVAAVADELVVVDTGGESPAVALAQAAGALIVDHPWDEDFSAAKNAGLAACSGDWIFCLEPGELLTPDDAERLREWKEAAEVGDKAYVVLVRNALVAGLLAAEQAAEVRLIPRQAEVRFAHRSRPALHAALEAAGLEVQPLPIVLFRDEVETPDRRKNRAQQILNLADLELKSQGPEPRLFNILGDAFQTLGDLETASRFFHRSISEAPTCSAERLEAFYGVLSLLDQTAQPRSELIGLCTQALEAFPLDMQLLCALGGYLQAEGHLEHAGRAYRLAFEHGQINPYLGHLESLHEIAAHCLAVVLQFSSQDLEAQRFLEKVLLEVPDSLRLRRQLLELHLKHGRLEAALEQVKCPDVVWPSETALKSTVRGACLARQKDWAGAATHLEAAYNSGYRDPLCLRFLVRALVENGRNAAAHAVLLEWKHLGSMPAAAADLLQRLQDGTLGPRTTKRVEASPTASGLNPAGERMVRIDNGQTHEPTRSPGQTVKRPASDEPRKR